MDQALDSLTLYPLDDVDFFRLWGKEGRFYQVTTATNEGVDTRLRVFDPGGALIVENDDYEPGNPASRVYFQAPGGGWLAVAVDSPVPAGWGCRQYSIRAVDVPPTPTSTVTPAPLPTATSPPTAAPPPTAIPPEVMYDQYEPNYDFGTAANVGVGQTLGLNFNPYPAGSEAVDNDFFRLYVKAGERLLIETTELAPGLDTNIILYRGNGQVVTGNDDCAPGERRSCIEWTPEDTGLAFLLIGPVGPVPEATTAGARAYSLVIQEVVDETPTPTSTASGGSSFSTPTPVPEAMPTPVVRVRPLSPSPPTPTPRPRQSLTVNLTVYYDGNDNGAPDAGEGVVGVSVRLLDGLNNQLLGQAFTDAYGHAALTVATVGQVWVSVPYLGYNQAVRPPGKSLMIRVVPLRLPSLIP